MAASPISATRYSAYPSGFSVHGKKCGPYSIVSVLLFLFFVWYIFDPPDRFPEISPAAASAETDSIPVHHSKSSLRPASHLCNEDDALGHVLPANSRARCLDGSLPMFYHRRGRGEGKRKWAIYFEGGGWCFDAESCKLRGQTYLGSSKDNPRSLSKDWMTHYISPVRSENPMMSGWNVVYVRYCDGGSYAGDATAELNGTKIYYRGQANRDETIRALLPLGLRYAKEVVILGCSAGALGVYLGIDAIANLIHTQVGSRVIVRGLADSGFFMDFPPYYAHTMERLYDMMNLTAGANAACVAAMHSVGKPAYGCVFAKHLLPHTRTPVFSLHSQYDLWQIMNSYGRNHTAATVNDYGLYFSSHLLHASLAAAPNSSHGVFIESCTHHCTSCSDTGEDTWNGEHVVARSLADGQRYSPAQAFKAWYAHSVSTPQSWSWAMKASSMEKKEREVEEQEDTLAGSYAAWGMTYQLFVQNGSFPCNSCCACSFQ